MSEHTSRDLLIDITWQLRLSYPSFPRINTRLATLVRRVLASVAGITAIRSAPASSRNKPTGLRPRTAPERRVEFFANAFTI